MRKRKHSKVSHVKRAQPKRRTMNRRKTAKGFALGVIVLVLIAFVGMSYTNKVDGYLPKSPNAKGQPSNKTSVDAKLNHSQLPGS